MPVTIEALGISQLSVRERLDLIEQIWDSLPEKVSPDEVPEWHGVELAKRRGGRHVAAGRQAMARGSGLDCAPAVVVRALARFLGWEW